MNKCVLSLTVALALFGRVSAASAGPAVAAGSSHVVVLTDSGTVWAWGYNAYGQLGDGTTFTRVTPTSIAITGITAIAAGGQSTYALKTDGTIWAWGMNSSGQLGDGTTTNRTSPVAVSSLSSIIAIAAGGNHAMALKSDGTVWAWGWNVYGQIGDNSTTNRTTPVQVSTLGTSVQAIGAADTHSHATKTDGTVWAWGHNQLSEAGDGTTTSPRKVPVQTGSLSSMTRVDAGGSNGFAWDASNALKAWGWNGEGELGDGTTTNRANPVSISGMSTVVSLHGGLGHTVAAKADGSAWAWGLNTYGQIGDTTTTSRTAPVQVSALDSVVSISAGYYFSVAVSSDGRVWTWGNNSEGQLGDGTYATRKAPVQLSDASFAWRVATPTLGPAGGSFTANVTVTVACVTPAATIHYTTNGVDPTDSDPTIATGSTVAVTQTTTLKAKAWLAGMPASSMASATYTLTVVAPSFSPFGTTYASAQNVTLSTTTGNATIRYTTDGTTPTASSPVYASPIAVSTGMTLKAIGLKTGWTTSAAATSTYTFNYGTLAAPVFSPVPGQVGDGTPVTISAAAFATIRFTTNGTTPTASSTIYTGPITVSGTVTINAKAFHPDWTTSPMSGGGYTIKVGTPVFSPDAGSFAPGQIVTVTDVTPNAVIRYTTNGADPTTTDPAIASGGTVVAGNYTLKARAFLTGWTSSDIRTAAYALTGPFTSWAASAGYNHSVALKNDGTVWTWGAYSGGALGDASTAGRSTAAVVNGVTGVVAVSAGAIHSLALRSNGTVWAWGDNTYGQLGDNTTTGRSAFAPATGLSSLTAISAGLFFSVALKSDGTVWAWGDNSSGQLGDGTLVQRNLPAQVPGLTGVVAVSAGDNYTLARKNDGTVWAWGDNAYGQLGDGTTTRRTSPVTVPGLTASAGPWAGSRYAFAASSTGALYAWGWNSSGQLGTGGGSSTTPVLVSSLANVTAVDGSGNNFSIARMPDGSAWTWGFNNNGQLGDGTTANSTTPYQVAGVADVSAVGAGLTQSVIVTSDGSVWTWGYNSSGELGDGTLNDRWLPVRISDASFNWRTSTPRLAPYTGSYSAPTSVTVTAVTPGAEIHYTTNGVDPTLADASVASGGSVVIDQSGTLKAAAWAAGMPASNVASAVYTMNLPAPNVLPSTGTYLATQSVTMSAGVSGASIRYTTDGTDPTAASSGYSGAITVDATTTIKAKSFKTGWTDSAIVAKSYTLKVVPPTFTPADGSYGSAQTVALATTTPSATIRYAFNGTEPTTSSPVYTSPITVGSTTTVKAVASRAGWVDSDSGAASFWFTAGTADTPTFSPPAGSSSGPVFVIISTATTGATVRYTLDGGDPTMASAVYQWPIRVDATTTIKARAYRDAFTPSGVGAAAYALDAAGAVDTPLIVPAGGIFAAGLTAAATVQATGATLRYTTSGVDPTDTDPVVPSGGIAVDRSMVVKVKAWSASAASSAVRRADFVITGAVSASEYSSHALKADGTVWSWGANGSGQLGDGSSVGRTAPVAAQGLTTVVGIASATNHTLAVKADGTVWSWGYNGNSELGGTSSGRNIPGQVDGLTNIVAVAAGNTHSVALRNDGTVWTWGGNASGQLGDGTTTTRSTPAMIAGLSGVSRIAAGYDFTLAVESDGMAGGRVWAWGSNGAGQLGDGSRVKRLTPVQIDGIGHVTAIAAGWDFSLAATSDGEVWAWGANGYGQLGDGTMIDRLTPVEVTTLAGGFAVSAGRFHAAAITNDGRVWAWGDASWYQLADGSGLSHNFPQPVVGLMGDLALAAGHFYTIAVEPNGAVMAWGANGFGQLGDGTTIQRAAPVSVSGLSLAGNAWLIGDQDADGLPTWREYLIGTDPLNADSTGSGIGDRVLAESGYRAANSDLDGDGLSNAAEIALGTDPFNPDTDGDGVVDGLDAFPLDPTRSQPLPSNPLDHTPPVITLIEPIGARRIS